MRYRRGSSSAGVRAGGIPITLGAISRASLLLGLATRLSSRFPFPTPCGTLPPGSSAGTSVLFPFLLTCLLWAALGPAAAPALLSSGRARAALQWRRSGLPSRCSSCCRRRLWVPELAPAAPTLWRTGSVVGVHRLSCSTARGVSPQQGLNPWLPHGAAAFFTSEPAGVPKLVFPMSKSEVEPIRAPPLPTPARQEGWWW